MFGNIFRFIIRTSAFLRKEIVNILRQPRLALTLVIGPFLILFIFGVGFNEEAPKLRTLFVAEDTNDLRPYIEEYATSLGPQLVYAGLINDHGSAIRRLNNGLVDAIIFVPEDAIETIESGESAVFQVLHNEIMPTDAGYVQFTMSIYIDELNRRVLTQAIRDEQQRIAATRTNVQTARERASAAHDALTSRDMQEAQQSIIELDESLQTISPTMQALTQSDTITANLVGLGSQGWVSSTAETLGEVQTNVRNLREAGLDDVDENAESIAEVEADLAKMETMLSALQDLEASVVTSPFRSETQSITAVTPEMIDYYTPAVIALLLQHLCVTFAALSIVQEELLGSMEVFRVAPIASLEMLLGKYLSYLLFNSLIAAALSALIVYVLDVPMVGEWWSYVVVMLGLMFASLGLGFLVSMISQSTSQAVQVSMLLLLSSVFFTGFFLSLESLKSWTRPISWALPATYAISLFQDIMLRGRTIAWIIFGGLLAMGLVLFILNWILLHHRMKHK